GKGDAGFMQEDLVAAENKIHNVFVIIVVRYSPVWLFQLRYSTNRIMASYARPRTYTRRGTPYPPARCSRTTAGSGSAMMASPMACATLPNIFPSCSIRRLVACQTLSLTDFVLRCTRTCA